MPVLPGLLASLATRRPQADREAARAALRERILGAIEREPGASPTRLVADLGIGWSTLYHHVNALEAQGRIRAASAGRHTFLYPAGMAGDPRLSVQRSVLSGGRARLVAAEAARTPGHDVGSLAEALDISPRVVYHHVRRLVEAGLLRSSMARRYRDLAPTEPLLALLRQEGAGAG
jgi:predicted transcriptional regulator